MATKKRPAKRKAAPRKAKGEGGPFHEITHQKQRAFLTAYSMTANITQAAAAAGVSRESHYVWKKDAAYADAFKLAEDIAGDTLEAEAVRRAVEGVEEPIVHHGRIMGLWILPDGRQLPGHTGEVPPEEGASFEPIKVIKRSDMLLKFMVEGHKSNRYSVHRHQISGTGGGPVSVAGHGVLLIPANPESLEEWERQHGEPSPEGDPL